MHLHSLRLGLFFACALVALGASAGPARAVMPLCQELAAPTNLVAEVVSPTEIHLTWTDNSSGETGYHVARSLDGGANFSSPTLLGPDLTSFVDSGRTPCTQYTYRVRAVAAITTSPYSEWASATTTQVASGLVTVVEEHFEGGAVPADWDNTGWARSLASPSPAGGYNMKATSSGGVLRTPLFDCSDAQELTIEYYRYSTVTNIDTSYYRVYLEGSGDPLLLAEYDNSLKQWVHEPFAPIAHSPLFASTCAVSFHGRVNNQIAYLDAVLITKRVAPPTLPTEIVQHPASASVCAGATAAFSVQAAGEALSYQWQTRQGTPWQNVGTNSPLYETNPLASTDSGTSVRCLVSGTCGVAYTYPATLEVASGADIVAQPGPQIVCSGAGATFAVSASGESLTYQWQRDLGAGYLSLADGNGLSGATSPQLTLTAATPQDAGTYRCLITSGCGTLTSQEASLAILPAPLLTAHPQDQTVEEGASARLLVATEGEGLTYQWEASTDGGTTFVPIPGAAGNTYDTPILGLGADGQQYRCVVSSACGTSTSDPAVVSVLRAQEIPLQPGWNLVSLTVAPPDPAIEAVLTSIAGGYSLVYAWQQGSWRVYDPAAPPASDLDALDNTVGFWVLASQSALLRPLGRVPAETTIPLAAGWTLAAYPAGASGSLADSLCAATGGTGLVYAYAAGDAPLWRHYDCGAAAWSNTLDALLPGRGYWILSAQDGEWRVVY